MMMIVDKIVLNNKIGLLPSLWALQKIIIKMIDIKYKHLILATIGKNAYFSTKHQEKRSSVQQKSQFMLSQTKNYIQNSQLPFLQKRKNNIQIQDFEKEIKEMVFRENSLCPPLLTLHLPIYKGDEKIDLKNYELSLARNYLFEYNYVVCQELENKENSLSLSDAISERAVEAFKSGNQYMAQGRNQEAIKCFEDAIEQSPNFVEPTINLGYLYNIQNFSQKSQALLSSAFSKSRQKQIIINNEGVILLNKDFERAIEDFQLSNRIKKNIPACNNLGYIYLQLLQFRQAISWFQKALAIEENIDSYNGLSIAFASLNEISEANQCFNKALEQNEKRHIVLNNLGIFYIKLHSQKSPMYFRKAYELEVESGYAQNGFGLLKVHEKQYNEALEHFLKAAKIEDKPIFHQNVMTTLLKLGKNQSALEYFEKLSENQRRYINLVNIFQQLMKGKSSKVNLDFIEKISQIKQNKFFHMLLNNIGCYLAQKGIFEESIMKFIEAFKIRNEPRILINIGCLYFHLKQYENATMCFEESLKRNPNIVEANYLMGVLNSDMKNYEKSVEFFEKCIEIDEENVDAINALGVVSYKMNKLEESLSIFNKCLSISPFNSHALSNKAILLSEMEETIKVDNFYRRANQKSIQILYNKSCFLTMNKKKKESIEILQNIIKNNSFFEAYHNLALILITSSKREESIKGIKLLGKAILLNPDNHISFLVFSCNVYKYRMKERGMNIVQKIKTLPFTLNIAINLAFFYQLNKENELFKTHLQIFFNKVLEESLMVEQKLQFCLRMYFFIEKNQIKADKKYLTLALIIFYGKLNHPHKAEENTSNYLNLTTKQQSWSKKALHAINIELKIFSNKVRQTLSRQILMNLVEIDIKEGILCFIELKKSKEFSTFFLQNVENKIQSKRCEKINEIAAVYEDFKATLSENTLAQSTIISHQLINQVNKLKNFIKFIEETKEKVVIVPFNLYSQVNYNHWEEIIQNTMFLKKTCSKSMIPKSLCKFVSKIFFNFLKLKKAKLTRTTIWDYLFDDQKLKMLDQLIKQCKKAFPEMLTKYINQELEHFSSVKSGSKKKLKEFMVKVKEKIEYSQSDFEEKLNLVFDEQEINNSLMEFNSDEEQEKEERKERRQEQILTELY